MDAGVDAEALRTDMLNALGFSGGSWGAAQHSDRRGYVQWNTLDTAKELPRGTRREIVRKARWADAEVGLVKRANAGLANMVGYQTPQADTDEGEYWNKTAEEAVLRRWDNPDAFDVAGKLDAWSWQLALSRCRFRDGDNLTALGESESGGAMVNFYESHHIDSGSNTASNLVDGVFIGRGGRHNAYQLCGRDPHGRETFTRINARDAIYHAEHERPGRVREVSRIAHAINNIVDMIDILADTKHGVKIAAQWGVVMTTQGAGDGGKMSETLASFLNQSGVGTNTDNETAEINVDTIMRGGKSQSLPSGADMKVLQDNRPHPNQMDLLRWLVRDIAWGAGVAPEILWEQAGLGSAATRYLMADTRRWIENQQRIQRRACQRLYTFTLGKEIKAGRVPMPKTARWWKCDWIPQSDMTIDRGRDGALEIKQIENNLLSPQESYARRGKDWRKEYEKIAEAKAEAVRLGITPEDVAKSAGV